ncbi:hypothetical protein M8R20_15950 [Pseudomonas sp. R2.Fl]|nr:hypothetical protein [Pseudomonas sp. R2.Fl]
MRKYRWSGKKSSPKFNHLLVPAEKFRSDDIVTIGIGRPETPGSGRPAGRATFILTEGIHAQ